MQNALEESAACCLHTCLDRVRKSLPAVDRVLTRYGHLSLLEYLKQFPVTVKPPFQCRKPLFHLVYRYISPLLGAATARRTVEDFATHPLVLTTSHHGVDYYAQTLQSRLILALRNASRLSPVRTIVVFACGNIPLNNLTYPRGLLFYRLTAGEWEAAPRRLPVFPHRLKRSMVSVAPAWDSTMLGQARPRLDSMIRQGRVAPEVGLAARTLLAEDYPAAALQAHPDYSTQAVVLNCLIWRKLFAGAVEPPELIYLELEKVASGLLSLDLTNPLSLAWGVLFDKGLRERVLTELDGVRGCWDLDLLSRGSGVTDGETGRSAAGQPCGTVFFWGVDQGGRRVPLDLQTLAPGRAVLRGMNDAGTVQEIPCSPHDIAHALQNRRLVPSLFTSFLVIAFARGVCCIGGYFQGDYLPAMQRGLAAALQSIEGYEGAARAVLEVPTTLYLDGMTTVMTRTEDACLIPAGPLEIIAGGGLTSEDLKTMGSLTVMEAHLADLFESFPDVTPPESRMVGWQRRVAAECSRLLEGKVVIK